MNLILFCSTLFISATVRSTFGLKVNCVLPRNNNSTCYAFGIEVSLGSDLLDFDLNDTNASTIHHVFLHTKENDRGFTAFPAEIFEIFPDIETVSIKANLVKLSKDDWKNGKNLKSLILSNNKLSECITFNGLKRLEKLYLSYNQITIIRRDVLAGLDKLELIDLKFNRLHTIESGACDGLTNLQKLDVEFNQLTMIRRGTFVGLDKLHTLEANSNLIHTIEDGAFDAPDLRKLKLSYNKLTTVSDSVFLNIPNLEIFRIGHNRLTRIDPSMFSLKNLTHMDLSDNHIENIDLTEFAKFRRLKELHLSRTGFSFDLTKGDIMEENNIEDNTSLEYLNIDDNDLANLYLNQLGIFKGLQILDMIRNPFTNYDFLNAQEIKTTFPKLKRIAVDGTGSKCETFKTLVNELKALNVSVVIFDRCWP